MLHKPKNTASEAEQRAEAPTSDSASLRSLDVHNAILRRSSSSEDRKRKKKHRRAQTQKTQEGEKSRRKKRRRRLTTPSRRRGRAQRNSRQDDNARAAEFRTWLRDAKDLLGHIAADEARKLFAQFAERERGPPRRGYYSGGRPATAASARATRRSFKLSDTEARGLASTRAAVGPPVGAGRPADQVDKQPAVVKRPAASERGTTAPSCGV